MQDIQFLSRRFLGAWTETGGFRNYQLSQWKQIYGKPIQLKVPSSNTEERAFELAYEVHLVFKQLATKILQPDFGSSTASKDSLKLSLELNRLKYFWETGDLTWAVKKRSEIPSAGDVPAVYQMVDDLCRSLIEELEPPLNVYNWMKAVTKEDELGYETAISFKGHPIFVLKNPKDILEARKTRNKTFFVTGAYLQMMKGIGVQEQDHLNRVAREHPYYRKFSCQRLANDLIGALILEPDDIPQLYFCFFNISHFHHAITGKFPDKWPEIEKGWALRKDLPWQGETLERVCVTYLDHLEALI